MPDRSWVTVALLVVVAVLMAALLVVRQSPSAHAQASEGQAGRVIAIAAPYGEESLLYVIDTSREVVLVYGFHQPGQAAGNDLRNGVFEFLAGRLYQWDLMLAGKREYSMKGVNSLRGLRVHGPYSSEAEYQKLTK